MIDTLAYTKHLEANGFERQQAEALAEANNRYVVPDLATKTDLAATEARLITAIHTAIHTAQLQSLGIVTALLGLTVAIIKLF